MVGLSLFVSTLGLVATAAIAEEPERLRLRVSGVPMLERSLRDR